MAHIIKTRRSFLIGAVPTTLEEGQLAVNVPDKKIWIGDDLLIPVLIYDFSNTGVSDHTLLTNIGTNTHAVIDTHIANITGNPHQVTYEQLGGTQPAPVAHTHTLAADITDEGSMAYIDDAPQDGGTYGRNMGAWVPSSGFLNTDVFGGQGIAVEQDAPAAGQVTIHSESPQSIKGRLVWEDSGSAGQPAVTECGADQATATNMTQLVFSYTDLDGLDLAPFTELVAVGDKILLIVEATGQAAIFDVTAPTTDNGVWGKTFVVWAAGDGTLNPNAGDIMEIHWFPKAGDPVVGPHTHDHDGPDIINTGTNTHAAIDAHIADVTTNPHAVTYENLGGTQPAPVAHTHAHEELTGDIGTNTHTQLDAHVADITTNPHQVTADDVGAAPLDHDHDGGIYA